MGDVIDLYLNLKKTDINEKLLEGILFYLTKSGLRYKGSLEECLKELHERKICSMHIKISGKDAPVNLSIHDYEEKFIVVAFLFKATHQFKFEGLKNKIETIRSGLGSLLTKDYNLEVEYGEERI